MSDQEKANDGVKPEMIDHGVIVKPKGDQWHVYFVGEEDDYETFDTEEDALNRADDMSDEYESFVQLLDEDGDVDGNMTYDDVP
ncbi:hypothetical protein ABID56_000914 [Alkalibacillus flavidus]|uniref:DUF2188 domain-containing protein n=1 Tax=Alkalibacillus flavidus TaxID=546021 RepID=A0ABV2KTX2_9BACI